MNRRQFLNLGARLGTGAVIAANTPTFLSANTPSNTAAKARKVIDYVQKDNLNKEQSHQDYKRVELTLPGGKGYLSRFNVYVPADANSRDTGVYIVIRSPQHLEYVPGVTKTTETFLDDLGADGILDRGHEQLLSGGDKNRTFDRSKSEGLENREFFQQLYDQTLDKLVAFYEGKK